MSPVGQRTAVGNHPHVTQIRVHATTWMEQAACVGEDPALWFPTVGKGRPLRNRPLYPPNPTTGVGYAIEVCGSCPVREACLAHAVTNGLEYGIFGGLLPSERGQ